MPADELVGHPGGGKEVVGQKRDGFIKKVHASDCVCGRVLHVHMQARMHV